LASPSENFQFFSGFSPLEEAALLLLLRDVQEELQDHESLAREVALEGPDVLEAVVPDSLADERPRQLLAREDRGVHAHHQHFFVIGAVEDADPPALGQRPGRAPQEVVVELLRGRRLEGEHLAALRVDARHHVLDRPVLAGGVHRLEDQEHAPLVLRVEPVLQLGQELDASPEVLDGLLLRLDPARVVRVEVAEAEALAVRDAERLDELGDAPPLLLGRELLGLLLLLGHRAFPSSARNSIARMGRA
jgi:hypothetical protein